MSKVNCWEVKNCGREPGGERITDLGICPAATVSALHGVHGGHNFGRACWAVAGTFCGGQVQGGIASKLSSCMECDFFWQVQREEGNEALSTIDLLAKLRT